MFEKFNDAARRALAAAANEARDLNSDVIDTGHLLLGLTKMARGEQNKAVEAFLALRVLPQEIRDHTLAALPAQGASPSPGHLPFTPETKKALELTVTGSHLLGDSFIGPEHLLAGLVRTENSTAGKVLARLGITEARAHAAIKDSTPALSPTAARTCAVYVPVGKSVFKNGGKIYPDLATAQAAHPDQEIAPLTFPLNDGEFFDVGAALPQNRFKSWGSFADYPAAFAAAAEFQRNVSGYDIVIRVMVRDVRELRGKDGRGHDVILGRSVEYSRVSLVSRLASTVD